jgi:hypothetical protein
VRLSAERHLSLSHPLVYEVTFSCRRLSRVDKHLPLAVENEADKLKARAPLHVCGACWVMPFVVACARASGLVLQCALKNRAISSRTQVQIYRHS